MNKDDLEQQLATLRAQLDAKEAELHRIKKEAHESKSEVAAFLDWLRNQQSWEGFWADGFLGEKPVSQAKQNLQAIRKFLEDSGHGLRFLAERDKLRAEVEELKNKLDDIGCALLGAEMPQVDQPGLLKLAQSVALERTRLTAELDAVRKELEKLRGGFDALGVDFHQQADEFDAAQARCGELEKWMRRLIGNFHDQSRDYEAYEAAKKLLTPSQQPDNLKGGDEPCAQKETKSLDSITPQKPGEKDSEKMKTSASNPQPESPIPSGVGQPSRPEPVKAGDLDDLKAFLADAITAQIAEARRWEDYYKTDPDGKIDRGFWEGKARAYEECLSLITDAIAPEGKATEGEG